MAGHRFTVEETERRAERERIWLAWREATLSPPLKANFDQFWDAQHGVRGLFVMTNLLEFPSPLPFKEYARALGWGYPTGVGYRYLDRPQSYMLLGRSQLPPDLHDTYMDALCRE